MPDSQAFAGWTILIDLDGTLIDTAPDLHAALNHCLSAAGYETVAFDTVASLVGDGAKAMISKALVNQGVEAEPEAVDALWPVFLDYYREHICVLSQPYPGLVEALDTLTSAGAVLAVATNKTQALADELLGRIGLAERFAAIVGADAVSAKKPDAAHLNETLSKAGSGTGHAIMIGDSMTDKRAARNSGLPFIFVHFGYGGLDEPGSVSEANHWADIPAMAESIVDQAASADSTGR